MSSQPSTSEIGTGRAMLRHALATLAYRGSKAVRGAPPEFAAYGADNTDRTPARILAHIGDLMDWAVTMAAGNEKWHDSAPLTWEDEIRRFHHSIGKLDLYLSSDVPLMCSAERLFQGPIADALTHVGQIAMLRRMAGFPMKGENYFLADIVAGRVSEKQAAPKKEF